MERKTVDVERAAEGHIEALRFNGVDYVFGSPGSDDAPYWNYFADLDDAEEGPTYVQCRHEQLAVDMARGYTTLTGAPQAVKLHVTVGPLNAALSLWGAYQNSTPLVLLSSYVRRHEGGKVGGLYDLDFHQPGGHENNFARFMKWCATLESNETAPHYLARAFRLASSSPPGPVMVNIPKELPAEPLDSMEVFRATSASPPGPGPEAIEDVAARLAAAENPLALTGRVGGDPDAVESLVTLAERLEMPVFEVPKVRNGFPMDHHLYIGNSAYGVYHTPDTLFARDIDLVFVVDTPTPWYPPLEAAPDADVVMLGPDITQSKRAYWNYPADVLVEADTARGLAALVEAVPDRTPARPVDWRAEHEQWRDRFRERAAAGEGETPIDPFWLSHVVDEALPDDAVIVNETIDHGSCVSNLVGDGTDRKFISPERMNSGGLGSGLGIALGAKLAAPDRVVALLVGDGSYHYNPVSAAFGAAQEHDLPIMVIIYNNDGYQVMRAAFEGAYPDQAAKADRYGAPIDPTPDYAAQASAWSAHGERVADPDEVEAALDRAVNTVQQEGRSALLDIALPDEPIVDHPAVE
jgi:acetolactate synthase-1/2/3 large subunit